MIRERLPRLARGLSSSAFVADEAGATAVEYGLLAGLIAVAIIVGASAVSAAINGQFDRIIQALTGH